MAYVVSSESIRCPECGAVAIAKIWSCGCVAIGSPPAMKTNCSVKKSYWTNMERKCRDCPKCHG